MLIIYQYLEVPNSDAPATGSDVSAQDFQKAQKFCKWAISAIDYEDSATAIENLEKALKMLKP